MKKLLFIAIVISLFLVSCSPDKKDENKTEKESGGFEYGEIIRIESNFMGIVEYDSDGNRRYNEEFLEEYGGVSLNASFSENCIVLLDGKETTIDNLKKGMMVSLYNELGVSETFPEKMEEVYKIEAYTKAGKSD